MAKATQPRHGSMQFWPRKRAARPYARLRNFAGDGLTAVAGFKMGMTHVKVFDTDKNSPTKNETIALPVTILECPPLKIFSVRAYTHDAYGHKVAGEVVVAKEKHLGRKVSPTKKPSSSLNFSNFDRISVLLMTQPHLTGVGQKKPQIFEVQLGGTPEQQLETAKELIGKEIKVSDILQEGEYVDIYAITTGRGNQGPVKRFGIGLKASKSEKGRRRPGSLGGWSGQQHFMYRVAMAGQTGYHQRAQYNNKILKITDNPEEINVKGGFKGYGLGRQGNEFILLQGSVPGPSKRLITLAKPKRLHKKRAAPTVDAISLESKQ
ncbi:MAG: 50S ribosomal protein L3 [Candidatus Woesearchaeota archaeon]|nr:50S ribosomal protein L3 [Candidatus Woesearchaeota archaeon]